MSICNELSCFPGNVEQQSGIIRAHHLDVILLSTHVSPHLEAHPDSHNESYWSGPAWLSHHNIFIRASVQMKELSSCASHKSGFVALIQRMHPTLILEWFMSQRMWGIYHWSFSWNACQLYSVPAMRNTGTQTGPVLFPRLLTREGKKKEKSNNGRPLSMPNPCTHVCMSFTWTILGGRLMKQKTSHSQKKQLNPLYITISVRFLSICNWVGWLNAGKTQVF